MSCKNSCSNHQIRRPPIFRQTITLHPSSSCQQHRCCANAFCLIFGKAPFDKEPKKSGPFGNAINKGVAPLFPAWSLAAPTSTLGIAQCRSDPFELQPTRVFFLSYSLDLWLHHVRLESAQCRGGHWELQPTMALHHCLLLDLWLHLCPRESAQCRGGHFELQCRGGHFELQSTRALHHCYPRDMIFGCTFVDQKPHNVEVAIESCSQQRRCAIVFCLIFGCTFVDQKPHNVEVATVSCNQGGSRASHHSYLLDLWLHLCRPETAQCRGGHWELQPTMALHHCYLLDLWLHLCRPETAQCRGGHFAPTAVNIGVRPRTNSGSSVFAPASSKHVP